MPGQDSSPYLMVDFAAPPETSETRGLRARTARQGIAERRRVTMRLRQALEDGGLVLQYQPQIHLKSGMMRGAEAMIRLQHRRRGLILPHHFMPIAEGSDLIHEIGGWVLSQACAEAARWPARYGLSISLSHRQLRGNRLVKPLIEALSRSGLAPARLELGVTEAMAIDDSEDTVFSLKAAHGLGARLALNHFGTGYASLSALRRLPLSTLRLDRSIIRDIGNDTTQAALSRAAVEAGHTMGCAVLADGVETQEQSRLLDEIGCDEAQGPFFSQPLAAMDLRAKLNFA